MRDINGEQIIELHLGEGRSEFGSTFVSCSPRASRTVGGVIVGTFAMSTLSLF